MCKNEMSDAKHTPDMNDFWIDLDGEDVREVVCDLLLDEATQGADYCNGVASRIVACVNACSGMSDPAKEIASLRARIAELEQTPITNGGKKTVVEYLMELPKGYRERALEQYDPEFEPTAEPTSIQDAIASFADWTKTNEKDEFWLDVYDYYDQGTPLPPLPI
jgi:hypothetical protein